MDRLFYKSPAKNFDEAFPIGNGRLGAKIFGLLGHETICLNEESVWSGPLVDRNNSGAKGGIRKIRTLLKQERPFEAQEMAFETLSGIPSDSRFFCGAGEIHVDFYDGENRGLEGPDSSRRRPFQKFDSYRRELDFASGIALSTFSAESSAPSTADFSSGTTGSSIVYAREAFVSSSANSLVLHFSASTPKSIFFRLRIEKPGCCKKFSLGNDTVSLLDVSGIPYAIVAMASVSDGAVFVRGDNLVVEGADEATVYVDVESAFSRKSYRKNSGRVGKNPVSLAAKCADLALKRVCFASGASYENLRADHISEFSSQWNKTVLSAESGDCAAEELQPDSPERFLLDWNFSKYKLIASSKSPSLLPPLKCGIWRDSSFDSIEGKYDLSCGNFSMPFCFALGLPKFALSWIQLLRRLCKNGALTAQTMYGCQGTVFHGSTDLWGDPCPCGSDLRASFLPLGAAVLARLVTEYYEFTLDKKFLRKNYGVLKSACKFFADYLLPVEDGAKFSLSPDFCGGEKISDGRTVFIAEKNPVHMGAVRRLFDSTIKAMRYLGIPELSDSSVRFSSILSMLEERPEENSSGADFNSFLRNSTASIITSEMAGGRVEIRLLEGGPLLRSGSLKAVRLKGNLLADIEWRDGKFHEARLYARQDTLFKKDVFIFYQGKRYESHLPEGSIDLRNVLPTTI